MNGDEYQFEDIYDNLKLREQIIERRELSISQRQERVK